MDQETNHIAAGLAWLITQYKDKPHLEAVLSSYLAQVQDLEDVFFDILNILIDIDSQEGEQLDLLGRLVGEERRGKADTAYRRWIKARRIVNRSSGLPDEMLSILRMTAPNNIRTYENFYPASFLITLADELAEDIEDLAGLIEETRAGGVNGQINYTLTDDDTTFTFSSGDTEEASSDQGWADDSQTTGGEFADVMEA